LEAKSILFSRDPIAGRETVIGYDKQFRWSWMATQMNAFIVAADFTGTLVTESVFDSFISEAFDYASKHYSGWPRGLQSGLGVIVILASDQVETGAATYCRELKSGKKWAGFSDPVVIDTTTNQVHAFEKNPMWGRIYYPYFRQMIEELTR